MATPTKKETNKPAAAKAPRAPKAKPVAKETASSATSNSAQPTQTGLQRRREVVGTVVSDKMQKTIVVKVDRHVRHRLYKKYLTKSNRYKAHDEKNDAKPGDLVVLIESRPLSRDKRWALKKIIRRGGQAPEVNV